MDPLPGSSAMPVGRELLLCRGHEVNADVPPDAFRVYRKTRSTEESLTAQRYRWPFWLPKTMSVASALRKFRNQLEDAYTRPGCPLSQEKNIGKSATTQLGPSYKFIKIKTH